MLTTVWQDIQFGIGQFYRRPRFMLTIMLCLALGMGPNTTLFSLINELLFSTVNVEQPERLISVGNNDGGEPDLFTRPTSHDDFLYLSSQAKTFKGAFATSITNASLFHDNRATLITAQLVSSSYFDVLGRDATLGKTFPAVDEFIVGREPYVVMSHNFWQQKYQADPAIVGKTISLNGYDFEVLGVMAADFTGNVTVMTPDIWVPLAMAQQMRPDAPHMIVDAGNFWLQFNARLQDGETIESATAELRALSQSLIERSEDKSPRSYYATEYENFGIIPKNALKMMSGGLMFIGTLILLLACASVAALLLSRATERRQEMAVRVAMGASRKDLIRQMLIEGLLISLASGVLALLMTLWSRKYMISMLPELPLSISLSMPIDFTVIAYVGLIACIATLLFALAPALQASKLDIMPALKDQPVSGSFEKSTGRLRSFFLVVQFTLSVALLISAGVAIRSMQKATEIDPGFESHKLLVFTTQLSQFGFHGEEKQQLIQRFKQKFATIEGVSEVALARNAPFGLDRSNTFITVFDENATLDNEAQRQNLFSRKNSYGYTPVDKDYFNTTDIQLLKGRFFTDEDRDYLAPAAIINQAAADKFFPGQEALGQYLQVAGGQDAYEVVGIVETIKHSSLGEENTPYFYLPLKEDFGHGISIIMRTTVDPKSLVDRIKTAINEVEPSVAPEGIKTIDEMSALLQLPLILIAWLCGGLGILALILAIVGVYGSVAYSIQMRQQEVGVRLALGATPNQLIWMLLQKGLFLAGIGTVLGILLAFGITTLMAVVLLGSAQDPVAFIGVPVLLLGVCTFAILFPAYRTSYRQPMTVLRYE